MNTTIILIACMTVTNVSEAIINAKSDISKYVGERNIVESESNLPSISTNVCFTGSEKMAIHEIAEKHSICVLFIEGDGTWNSGYTAS